MLKPAGIVMLFSTILMMGCATGPSGQVFDSPIGEWREQYENRTGNIKQATLTIIDESSATYSVNGGRIQFYAIDGQRKWTGYWINSSGSSVWSCSEEKDGSPYWGVQIYQFNETYNQYTGTWDSCGEGRKFPVSGVR
jgi:hypothetical protein